MHIWSSSAPVGRDWTLIAILVVVVCGGTNLPNVSQPHPQKHHLTPPTHLSFLTPTFLFTLTTMFTSHTPPPPTHTAQLPFCQSVGQSQSGSTDRKQSVPSAQGANVRTSPGGGRTIFWVFYADLRQESPAGSRPTEASVTQTQQRSRACLGDVLLDFHRAVFT